MKEKFSKWMWMIGWDIVGGILAGLIILWALANAGRW